MTTFWLLVALMTAAGLVLLLMPLLRPPLPGPGDRHRDAELAVQRARAEALDRQLRDGTIDEDAYADARDELAREVLRGADAPQARPLRRRAAPLVALLVLIAFPLSGVGLYWTLGSRDALRMSLDPMASLKHAVAAAQTPEQLQGLADALRARLEERPEDLEGWRMLARARMATGRFARAEAAAERALLLSGEATVDLIDYAEAASMANDMRFPALAQERIETALRRAPDDPRALMLGALSAIQTGESDTAVLRLRRLMVVRPPQGERAHFIESLIARLERDAGASTSAPAAGAGIAVRVQVSETLSRELEPGQRVFVFARSAQGPPMPLAALSLSAAELPAEVVLDERNAMVPGRSLSTAGEVVVGARISASGSATPGSGDLEGFSAPLVPGPETRITVTIDRVRP